jgi:uncharacterized coiled-coil protein SlyX
MSAMALEARIANLEGTVEQIGQRLNGFDARFTNAERKIDTLEERMNSRFDAANDRLDKFAGQLGQRFDALEAKFEARFQQVDRRFTWTVGLLFVAILGPVVEHFTLH